MLKDLLLRLILKVVLARTLALSLVYNDEVFDDIKSQILSLNSILLDIGVVINMLALRLTHLRHLYIDPILCYFGKKPLRLLV